MSERKIYVSKAWLKSLTLGMKLNSTVHKGSLTGQTVEIIGLEHDQENYMDGTVTLKLERRFDGKLTARVKFWWVYEHSNLVGM